MSIKLLKNKLNFIGIPLFYASIALFVLRKFLFRPGAMGHNWDWSAPYLNDQLIYMAQSNIFLWKELTFGLFNPLIISSAAFTFIWGCLGYLGFNGEFVSKLVPFITILISGISMFYLLKDIIERNSTADNPKFVFCSSLFGSVFYALSPYIFNDIIGGAATQFFTYAFFPLALYCLRKIEHVNKFIYLFLLAIILCIISFSFQRLFLVSLIIFIYPITSERYPQVYKKLIQSYILFISLSFYWVLFLFLGGTKAAGFAFAKENLLLSTIRNNTPSVLEAFVGLGYFRDFFKYSINPNIGILWNISSFGLLAIAIFSLITFRKIRQKETFFWIFLFLVALIFSTGGKIPLGYFVLWMYRNIPFMALFKSPQHLLILSTFSLSVVLGLGFFSFISKLKERKSLFLAPIKSTLFIFLIIWISPFLTGNLGFDYLRKYGGGNFVDVYQLSPGYKKFFKQISEEQNIFRILPLPLSHSPYYLKTEYQNVGQGGEQLFNYSKKPFILSGIPNTEDRITEIIEKYFYTQKHPQNISKLLSLINAEYILLRKDVCPIFGPYMDKWDYIQVYNKLNKIKNVSLFNKYDYVSLYKNSIFIPHIYTSVSSSLMVSNLDVLLPLTETKYLDAKPILLFSEQPDSIQSMLHGPKIDNFVFNDSNSQDLAVEMAGEQDIRLSGNSGKIDIKEAGVYEVYLDAKEIEKIPEFEIKVDGKEIALGDWAIRGLGTGDWGIGRLGRRYLKMGEAELGKGKHVLEVIRISGYPGIREKEIKLVLVKKEEREKLEKEIWERMNQSRTEVCYIFEKEKSEFYVP